MLLDRRIHNQLLMGYLMKAIWRSRNAREFFALTVARYVMRYGDIRTLRCLAMICRRRLLDLHVAGEATDVARAVLRGSVLVRCRCEGIRGRKSLLVLRMDTGEHVRRRVDTLTLRVQAWVERSSSLFSTTLWLLLLLGQVAATVLSH